MVVSTCVCSIILGWSKISGEMPIESMIAGFTWKPLKGLEIYSNINFTGTKGW